LGGRQGLEVKLAVAGRVTARFEGEIVVFLIGMRINRLWKIHKWLPVARAMPRMLRELTVDPDSGLLGFESWVGNPTISLQYWRSFEHLERYAKDSARLHRPAWAAFNRAIASNGDVGIWHETYRVRPGDFESIYNNMPAFGLAKATAAVPAQGQLENARSRMAAQ
jgi:Monooxygenase af470-like